MRDRKSGVDEIGESSDPWDVTRREVRPGSSPVRSLVTSARRLVTILVCPMVVVLFYIPWIGARAIRGVIGRSDLKGPAWQRSATTHSDRVRSSGSGFAPVGADLRYRRRLLVVGLVGVMILVGVSVWVVGHTPRSSTGSSTAQKPGNSSPVGNRTVFDVERDIRYSTLEAFDGVPFADELKEEQDLASNKFMKETASGLYDIESFDGKFTNVSDYERVTVTPRRCECREATVWFVGGSAAFGLGQRDDNTIASDLVKLGDEHDVSLTVRNFGVPGWTLVSEWQKVRDRLAAEPRPDVVVFYDGFNDVVGTLISTVVHGVDPDSPSVLDTADIKELSTSGYELDELAAPEEIGSLAARKYRRLRAEVAKALAAEGIGSLFVFQPDAFASSRQFDAVASVHPSDPQEVGYVGRVLATAAEDLEDGSLNLRDVFDDSTDAVFGNFVHTNERGARIVAERIYSPLVSELGL